MNNSIKRSGFYQLILSQDDMTVLLRTLNENLSEKSDAVQPAAHPGRDQSLDSETSRESRSPGSAGTGSSKYPQLKS